MCEPICVCVCSITESQAVAARPPLLRRLHRRAALAPPLSSLCSLSTLPFLQPPPTWPLPSPPLPATAGVSAEIYEARYRTVSGKHERWYNSSIASILRHLELPSHATTPGEKGAERRRRVKPRSRGGSSDGASMLGAHNNVLESDAMSPIDYHASGAISPEEELSERSLRLQQDRPTYSDPRRPSR